MKITQALRYVPAAMLSRAAHVKPYAIGVGNRVYGVPGVPAGVRLGTAVPKGGLRGLPMNRGQMKLGNLPADLSDYINTPGTPGSSTFYLYGLNADDDVTDSSSFWDSVTSVVQSAADAAKAIVPVYMQTQQQKAAADALKAGRISAATYQQMTSQPVATVAFAPTPGFATGMGIGGIALLAGAGFLGYMLLKKR